MSLPVIVLFVGIAYVLLVGGLSLFRREGLSLRLAIEAICLTGLTSLLVAMTDIPLNPVLFLILLYLLTMRVRILVDLANLFAKRGKAPQASQLYDFASHLWPDASGGLVLKVNQATFLLQENRLDESIGMFNDVLQQASQGYLGVKYEAAAHFNLGVAYQRKNLPGKAMVAFNAVIDTWPASLYAHRAQKALDRLRSRQDSTFDDRNANETGS